MAVTGAIDLVSDGEQCVVIRNGRPEMGLVTGTGCQLSALTAACLAASPERPLEAGRRRGVRHGSGGGAGLGEDVPSGRKRYLSGSDH